MELALNSIRRAAIQQPKGGVVLSQAAQEWLKERSVYSPHKSKYLHSNALKLLDMNCTRTCFGLKKRPKPLTMNIKILYAITIIKGKLKYLLRYNIKNSDGKILYPPQNVPDAREFVEESLTLGRLSEIFKQII